MPVRIRGIQIFYLLRNLPALRRAQKDKKCGSTTTCQLLVQLPLYLKTIRGKHTLDPSVPRIEAACTALARYGGLISIFCSCVRLFTSHVLDADWFNHIPPTVYCPRIRFEISEGLSFI